MKKLIIISVIFAVMIGGSIWEIAYSTRVYDDIYDGLIELERTFDEHENVYNVDSLAAVNEVYLRWESNKEALFCLGNHNVLRTIDEKIVSLKAMVDTDYTDDAKIMLEVAKELIKAVQNDTVPNMTNLF